ncbi:MAG: PEGA domain-containing protein [Deltaproteobacteria bacterium]|nr:PEGA domain-containing protein [Deltaproteobacteria bacterium]
MRQILSLGCLIGSLCASAPLLAQEQVEQAKTYFNAGASAYEAGQFQAAAQAFEQAYKLAPRPAILFSLAQAFRRQYYIDKRPDNLRQAIATYRDYLAKVQQGGRRADAAQALAELEPIASRQTQDSAGAAPVAPIKPQTRLMISSQTSGATVILDKASAVPAPLISEVQPGKHHVTVRAPGYFDEDRDVAAAEGGVVAFDLALKEKPARLQFVGDSGAEISIDGRLAGTTPLATAIELPSGHHLITITKNGHKPLVSEMVLARDEGKTIEYALPSTGQRVASYGLLTGAALGVIAGGVFTGLSLSEQRKARDVTDAAAQGNILPSDAEAYDQARADRDRFRTAAAISFGSGLALGVTGLLLYAFDRPSVSAPPSRFEQKAPEPTQRPRDPASMEMSAAPFWAPGAAGVSFGGRF